MAQIEACMIWSVVGLGGSLCDCVRVNSHVCGFLVALHACWIDGNNDDDAAAAASVRFSPKAEEGRVKKMRSSETRKKTTRKREDMACNEELPS